MCAALLVRRKQVLLAGLDDPFPSGTGGSGLSTVCLPHACQSVLILVALANNSSGSFLGTGYASPSTEQELASAHPYPGEEYVAFILASQTPYNSPNHAVLTS
jgi:hypothetical protein